LTPQEESDFNCCGITVGGLIGILIGGLAAIAIAVIAIVCVVKKMRAKR